MNAAKRYYFGLAAKNKYEPANHKQKKPQMQITDINIESISFYVKGAQANLLVKSRMEEERL